MAHEFDLSDPDAVAFCPSCNSGYTARVTRCPPCDVALIPREEVEAAAGELPPDFDEAGESTVLLCRLDDPAKGHLLGVELERAGVPYWPRSTPFDPLGGIPNAVEFRVPARYADQARRALRRVESYSPDRAVDDTGAGA